MSILNTGKSVKVDGEIIAVNAALLRLFKGEYRDSGDRHSDSLLARDFIAHLQSQLDDLKAFVQKDVQEKGEYGRCGYGQPTRRALEAQALLASIDAATSALTAQDKGAT
jgi:hypothetical protein